MLDGIQAVQKRLADRRVLFTRDATVTRDPALVEVSRPASTVEEFGGYVWSDKTAKEQPVKIDDHGLDACRYVVAQRDLGARPGVRWT